MGEAAFKAALPSAGHERVAAEVQELHGQKVAAESEREQFRASSERLAAELEELRIQKAAAEAEREQFRTAFKANAHKRPLFRSDREERIAKRVRIENDPRFARIPGNAFDKIEGAFDIGIIFQDEKDRLHQIRME